MKLYSENDNYKLYQGDCLEVMKTIENNTAPKTIHFLVQKYE